MEFVDSIKKAITCTGPIIVHSDIMKVMGAINMTASPNDLLQRHIDSLKNISDGKDIFFPSFNYDFPKNRIFNLNKDSSQVGALSEYARRNWADWRTEDPIFSFCGKGKKPDNCQLKYELTDPFSDTSVFSHIIDMDGTVLMYGASFSSLTLIHYIERLSGGPVYRYDKIFAGSIIDSEGNKKETKLLYHVRPMGKYLNYDWKKLTQDTLSKGLMKHIESGNSSVMIFNAKGTCEYWLSELAKDPLYLLDEKSKAWVELKFSELGRRFEIKDFEKIEVSV